jgi:hypothetical protein
MPLPMPPRALRLGRDPETPTAIHALRIALEFINEPAIGITQPGKGRHAEKMRLVVAPHIVVLIPNTRPRDVIRREQQPRIFEPATGEHILPRANREIVPGPRRHIDMPHRAALGLELEIPGVGVHEDGDVFRGAQFPLVSPPEMRGRTPSFERPRREGRIVEPGDDLRLCVGEHVACVEAILTCFAQRHRTGEKWRELLAPNRPAAMRHPVTALEIDLVEGNAASAPRGRAAAPNTAPVFL